MQAGCLRSSLRAGWTRNNPFWQASAARATYRTSPRPSALTTTTSTLACTAPILQKATMSTSTPTPTTAASSSLSQSQCVPCRKGSPMLSDAEIETKLQELGQDWRVERVSGDEKGLVKSYKFKNFRTALALTNSVGAIAEEQKHHPRLVTEWGSVEVAWWTHAIGGLHENDFIMAARTEELARVAEGRK